MNDGPQLRMVASVQKMDVASWGSYRVIMPQSIVTGYRYFIDGCECTKEEFEEIYELYRVV